MGGLRTNLAASSYFTVVSIGGQFVITPVLLYTWGKEQTSWWLLLNTIPAYFALSDVGLSTSLGNALTIELKQGTRQSALNLARAAWRWQTILWAILGGLFGLFAYVCPLQKLLGIDGVEPQAFIKCTLLLVLYSIATLQAGFYAAVFRSTGEYARFTVASGHVRLVEIAALIVCAVSGGGLVAASGVMAFVRIGFVVWSHLLQRKLVPDLHFSGSAPLRLVVRLFPSGLGFLGFPVGNALVNQGAMVLVNHLGGAADVISLTVGRQVARLFNNIASVGFASSHPEASAAFARGDEQRVRLIQTRLLAVVISIMPMFIAASALAGPYVVMIWTSGKVILTSGFIVAVSLEACASGLSQSAMLIPLAINRSRLLCMTFISLQSLALVGGLSLYGPVGLVGLVCLFTIASLLQAAVGLYLAGDILGVSGWELLASSLRYFNWGKLLTAWRSYSFTW